MSVSQRRAAGRGRPWEGGRGGGLIAHFRRHFHTLDMHNKAEHCFGGRVCRCAPGTTDLPSSFVPLESHRGSKTPLSTVDFDPSLSLMKHLPTKYYMTRRRKGKSEWQNKMNMRIPQRLRRRRIDCPRMEQRGG